jgi:hypothetical protein
MDLVVAGDSGRETWGAYASLVKTSDGVRRVICCMEMAELLI